jgi:hypothetical protein
MYNRKSRRTLLRDWINKHRTLNLLEAVYSLRDSIYYIDKVVSLFLFSSISLGYFLKVVV